MAPWTTSTIPTASSSSLQFNQSSQFPALSFWSSEDQAQFATIVDTGGDFNGTCVVSQENIPLLVTPGMCASWFSDMTVFCCAAVGGMLQHAATESTSSVNGSEEMVLSSNSTSEPLCMTSNYNDMLDCYKTTAEKDCRSTDIAPWGVCNPLQADTSRNQTGATNSSTSSSYQVSRQSSLSLLFMLVLTLVMHDLS